MMTKKQREIAEVWARVLMSKEGRDSDDVEVATLLRAGIAASEECERLRADNEQVREMSNRLAGMLYDEQLRRMRQPEGADVREMLRRLGDEEISNGKAAELILDFIAGASANAWLTAWDAEWRAQQAEAAEDALWKRIGESK